jgi:hypothetical protein
MTAKNKYKSPAFEAIHSAASGLFSVGAIPQEMDIGNVAVIARPQRGVIELRPYLNAVRPLTIISEAKLSVVPGRYSSGQTMALCSRGCFMINLVNDCFNEVNHASVSDINRITILDNTHKQL